MLAELQQRGIHQSPGCLEELADADWIRNAILLREKRFGLSDLSDDWDEKVRQARFLTRRGFSASQVEQALEVSESDGPCT